MKKNPYLRHLSKIEFVVTDACTGSCIHCSQGAHIGKSTYIDATRAAEAVGEIVTCYPIETLLTFGGEPLLHPEAVCAIQAAGKAAGIPHRQVITNGYVTRDVGRIRETVAALHACGVNDLRLSVDAFHQATIPFDVVKLFALEAQAVGLPVRAQPAWLVARGHDNPYNQVTEALLGALLELGIEDHPGNVVFFTGNAEQYLREYATNEAASDPYAEDPTDVRCVSILPNGDVLCDNLYKKRMVDILRDYRPEGAL